MDNIILFHQDLLEYPDKDIRLMAKHAGLRGSLKDLRWMLAIQKADLIVKSEMPLPALESMVVSGELTLKQLLELREINTAYRNALTLENMRYLVSKVKNVDDKILFNYIKKRPLTPMDIHIIVGLIQNPNTHPWDKDNLLIRWASTNGHVQIVKALLDNHANPAIYKNFPIRSASTFGHVNVVKELLKDDRVDPSAEHNHAIDLASKNGHIKVVKELLKDDRVDVSAGSNEALMMASEHGRVEVVKELLNNPRVELSERDANEALKRAREYGHDKVVKLLLEHPKVKATLKK